MKFLIMFVILCVALVVQSALMQIPLLNYVYPDFVLMFLVYFSFRFGPISGVFAGFLIGTIQDVYAIESLGINALVNSLIGYGIGLMDETRFSFTSLTKLIFLALAILLHDIFLLIVVDTHSESWLFLLKRTAPTIILTSIFGTLLFYYFSYRTAADE